MRIVRMRGSLEGAPVVQYEDVELRTPYLVEFGWNDAGIWRWPMYRAKVLRKDEVDQSGVTLLTRAVMGRDGKTEWEEVEHLTRNLAFHPMPDWKGESHGA